MVMVEALEPVATRDALVLVLGTLPGADSLKLREYYAKSTNAFWDIMGDLFGAVRSRPYGERVEILNRKGVAVWDVLRSADRVGSTDSGIIKGSEVANDFNGFFRGHGSIKRIFFNGGPAEGYFQALVMPHLAAPCSRIPQRVLASTSPANTHMTRQAKIAEWQVIERDLLR